jgi:hypothetical protein
MAQAVSRQTLTVEACVPFEELPTRICGEQNVVL